MANRTLDETAQEQHEEFVNAMWALFLIQNANPNPDFDGMFDLGVISDARPNQWTRLTPYSIAQGGLPPGRHAGKEWLLRPEPASKEMTYADYCRMRQRTTRKRARRNY